LNVKVTGEGTDWWGQNIRKNVVKEFYHVDVRGSLVNMTDGYGRVAMRADYDDWGDLTHSDSITINGGFRHLYLLDNYTGHEYDQVLELYHAKYRFYDPAERRFIAEDPIKAGANWFIYCEDNPIQLTDPLGLLTGLTVMPDLVGYYGHTASELLGLGNEFLSGLAAAGAAAVATGTIAVAVAAVAVVIMDATEVTTTTKLSYSTAGVRTATSSYKEIISIAQQNKIKQDDIEYFEHQAVAFVASLASTTAYKGKEVEDYFAEIRCATLSLVASNDEPGRNAWCVYILISTKDEPSGEVFYVGMTKNPDQRQNAHLRSKKDWIPFHMFIVVSGLPSRLDARLMEQYYMTVFYADIYKKHVNKIRSIAPGKMDGLSVQKTVAIAAIRTGVELAANISEDEVLALMDELSLKY
ncbi:MAG: GIY-YIG nuclease family protein, partial [Oscillospiraceae bacterium]|nr:GIY-YIG nuclease family protein [Oscillospiraceae bacterium]